MNRHLSGVLLAVAAVVSLGVSLPAAAQFAKPEDAIKYRKAAMTMMNTHVGRLFGMANGRIPYDAKVAAENADIAAAVSKWQFAGFVEGSDLGDTRALPKIWSELDKFKAAAAKSNEDIAKLDVAARAGSLDALKAAIGEVGKSCKACHDAYRKE
jgi:cytochrome c556